MRPNVFVFYCVNVILCNFRGYFFTISLSLWAVQVDSPSVQVRRWQISAAGSELQSDLLFNSVNPSRSLCPLCFEDWHIAPVRIFPCMYGLTHVCFCITRIVSKPLKAAAMLSTSKVSGLPRFLVVFFVLFCIFARGFLLVTCVLFLLCQVLPPPGDFCILQPQPFFPPH